MSEGETMDELHAQARSWLAQDPDPVTRTELTLLLEQHDDEALADRFAGPLEFGTAGLRGALGAGPNRMNRVVVAQAAAGLAEWLLAHESDPSVVIGHDARHNSRVFATDSAEILHAAGVHAYLLPEPVPTPVTAFAIGHLGCSAGIVVTASHNPPQDNGYKVYLADSSQIVPPADTQIAAAIADVGRIDALPRSHDYTHLDSSIERAYIDAVVALAHDGPRELTVVYTPLHGVGRQTLSRVAERAGFADVHVVETQADPDPDFPTVEFPNPEEPGAMDLALDLARNTGADVIIANDPDADRCAVGVRQDDDYRMLSGDQVGSLLGEFLLRRGVQGTYAASIVSSEMLGKQAAEYGQPWKQTLTGFKWLGKIPDLVFGFEEALGYSVAPHIARDKDGISAALAIMELAAELKAEGRHLVDFLDEIAIRHGWHETGQLSLRVDDLDVIASAMNTMRTNPPTTLADHAVLAVDDFAHGFGDLPPSDMIRLQLDGEARIICRPSGTEPKLKCYLQVVVPVDPPAGSHSAGSHSAGAAVDRARQQAQHTLESLKTDLAAAMGLNT